MENFPKFDNLIFLSGLKIIKKNKIIHFLNTVLSGNFLIQNIIRLMLNLYKLFQGIAPFNTSFYIISYFTQIISFSLFIQRKKKFNKLLDSIYFGLKQDQKEDLKRTVNHYFYILITLISMTIIIKIIIFILIGVNIKTSYKNWFLYSPDEMTIYNLIALYTYSIIFDILNICVPISQLLIYNLLLIASTKLAKSYINEINQAIISIKPIKIKKIRDLRKNSQKLRRKSNKLMGIFPFLWIALLFCDYTCRIASLVVYSGQWTIVDYSINAYKIILFTVVLIAIIFTAEYETSKFIKLSMKILNFAESLGKNLEMRDEIFDLKLDILSSPVLPVQAWNILIMNRILILSFAGSVIPLVVMIITTFQ